MGRDIGLTQLRELYDVVVLAHGCPVDKALGIPGEHLPGVWGSARFTGWYSAHPDHAGSGATDLPRSVIVLGNGNVAIDVARLLTKSRIDLAATDMHPAAVQVLGRSNVQKVMLVGRRAPIRLGSSVTGRPRRAPDREPTSTSPWPRDCITRGTPLRRLPSASA